MVILEVEVPGLSSQSLSRFASRASRVLKLKGSTGILVTGSQEMRSLNRRFRGKDKPTDVLTFPADPEFASPGEGTTGDLAISAQIAAANAHRFGHSVGEEVKILILHGMLHLAGYDHEADHGEMANEERRLRKLLRLPSGLIERTNQRPARKKLRMPAKRNGARR